MKYFYILVFLVCGNQLYSTESQESQHLTGKHVVKFIGLRKKWELELPPDETTYHVRFLLGTPESPHVVISMSGHGHLTAFDKNSGKSLHALRPKNGHLLIHEVEPLSNNHLAFTDNDYGIHIAIIDVHKKASHLEDCIDKSFPSGSLYPPKLASVDTIHGRDLVIGGSCDITVFNPITRASRTIPFPGGKLFLNRVSPSRIGFRSDNNVSIYDSSTDVVENISLPQPRYRVSYPITMIGQTLAMVEHGREGVQNVSLYRDQQFTGVEIDCGISAGGFTDLVEETPYGWAVGYDNQLRIIDKSGKGVLESHGEEGHEIREIKYHGNLIAVVMNAVKDWAPKLAVWEIISSRDESKENEDA